MDFIFKIGIIILAITGYFTATVGMSAFINADKNDESIFMCAVLLGAIYFMALLLFVLERFGLW